MVRTTSLGGKIFDIANYTILFIFAIVTCFPFVYVVLVSFTPPEELIKYQFMFFPKQFSLDAYRYVFSTITILKSLIVAVGVTIVGTFLNIIMTSLMAYPLAHRNLLGKKPIMMLVTFTLLFEGGIIPSYIVVQKLGMLNSYSSVLIPTVINAFNLFIFINFFKELPEEIEESAKIDGCHDVRILFSLILPLSMPLIATFIVLFGVSHWNTWFNYVLYIDDSNKWPIQVVLRQIMSAADASIGDRSLMHDQLYVPPKETIRMCIITIATLPIICIYPFLQKYFVKGIMLGSVKG